MILCGGEIPQGEGTMASRCPDLYPLRASFAVAPYADRVLLCRSPSGRVLLCPDDCASGFGQRRIRSGLCDDWRRQLDAGG